MRPQRGFTYLGVLLAIALLGIGMTAASEVWVTTARRQRMEQLGWVGQQYVQAIGSYYESSPGRVKAYPKTLEELLEDKRYAFVRRHLRQVYVNPFSGAVDWELIRAPDGGIRGIVPAGPKEGAKEFVYVPLGR
jgi:type II secretory pathway pseudopilin PulG